MIASATKTPNEVALELIGRDYLSFSAIRLFQRCPLAYRFKYLDGLPETVISSSLVFGGAIHTAVECHFNELMIGNSSPDLDMLLSAFWSSWNARSQEAEIKFGKQEDIDSIASVAERLLRVFQKSDIAIPSGRILGVEEEIHGKLIPGVPDLLARVDLVVEDSTTLTITDFKTARSRWTVGQAEDASEQLLLYGEIAKQLAPAKHLRLEFAVVTKSSEPVAERFPVGFDQQRLARTKQLVKAVWRAIESSNFYPSPGPLNCPSCPYRKPCRHWGN